MAKRIALCFDGTWNTPKDDDEKLWERFRERNDSDFENVDLDAGIETNACRLYRSILRGQAGANAENSLPQVKWYDKGVGTNWYDRFSGGVAGVGLSENIRQGYRFLSKTYEDGDEVFVFGFSRGAYTARSMVGMIRNSWLLPPNASESDLQEAYQIYRIRDGSADDPSARTFRKETGAREIEIKFLGVWDTVGALGIPLQSFGRFNADFYKFHDTELSRIVKNAYHAVAIDEHREAFKATLWDPKEKPGQTIEQRWFVGAHGDIGGGNSSRKLSDIGLRWMQLKAQKCGLRLDASGIPPKVDDGFLADIYDSFGSFLAGVYHFFGTRYYRPLGTAEFGNEALHSSVYQRSGGDKNYRPRNEGYATLLKAQPGEDD